MRILTLSLLITLALFPIVASAALFNYPGKYERVRLADVQALTFHKGEWTTARRVSAIPQLKNMGGSAKGLYEPDVVQCINAGWDGRDFQWKCEADMPQEYRFGPVTVVCEGFDNPQDDFILAGSCGLEYDLEFTEYGLQKRRSESTAQRFANWLRPNSVAGSNPYSAPPEASNSIIGSLLKLTIVGGVLYAIWTTCCSPVAASGMYGAPRVSRMGGFGNWFPGGYAGYGTGSYSGATPGYASNMASGGGASVWSPGFWTGLGVGGAMGNWWGRRRTAPTTTTHAAAAAPSSGWFGTSSPPAASSQPAPPADTTHTSHGYGGTRRR